MAGLWDYTNGKGKIDPNATAPGASTGTTTPQGGYAPVTGGNASGNPQNPISSAVGSLPGVGGLAGGAVGNVLGGMGITTTPQTWDPSHVNPQLQQSTTDWSSATAAAAKSAAGGPQYQAIGPLQTARPQMVGGLPVAEAQNVSAGGNIVGDNADALRVQQLSQAQAAANSPSSAAAQMRAAGAQIEQQQAGLANQSRGADRASARRDAMLATGTQGMQAASQSAALAAQEQAAKQQAYTGALAGVRTGDVSTANTALAAQTANQGANLQATGTNIQAGLAAQTANQGAGLQATQLNNQGILGAGTANQAAAINAYNAQNQAQNAYLQTANQAAGVGNQANATVAQYQANYDKDLAAQKSAAAATGSGLLSSFGLSDERAKDDIQPIGGASSWASAPSYQQEQMPGAIPMNVIPTDPSNQKQGGLSLGSIGLGSLGGGALSLSDERAKQQVSRMDPRDVADWAESVPTAAFRFKPGIDGAPDNGERYHVGTVAQDLEQTGPMGKMLVTKRPDGLREVDYGPAGLMVGKGALSRADEALNWAKAAYALAAHGRGLQHG